MNRQNFFGHLALALTLILLAGVAGQIRRWQKRAWTVARVDFEYQQGDAGADGAGEVGEARGGKAEVLVHFRDGVTLDQIKEIAAKHNDRFEDDFEYIDPELVVIEDEDGLSAERVAREYESLGSDVVEYADPNFTVYADHGLPGGERHKHANDKEFFRQWALENNGQNGGTQNADISVLRAWFKTTGSSKVVVAVLDSGVDYTHKDLMQNMWVRPAGMKPYVDDVLGEFNDRRGFNATDNWRDPMDDNGHGTHCAGIIGAEGNNNFGIAGVNWNVQIMPLKFLDSNGSGTTKDAIEAINYVIERKRAGVQVRIISASWGSTQNSRALRDAIKKAGDEGILFVAAAGNAHDDADKRPHYPAGYKLPNVISVAATDSNDKLTDFSNFGAKSVFIAAPGKGILSTWLNGEFKELNGTSMATPQVAGVAALVLSTNPKMTVAELRERLANSVDKLDSLKGKVATGGRINAAKAVGAE